MESISEEKKMEISHETLINLNATRKWTTFLSVFGFITIGLFLFVILATGTFLTTFKLKETNPDIQELVMIIALIAIAVIYFFSVLFLFRFSKYTRDAIHNRDIKKLEKAFKNLRSYFTYIGIILIIALALYVYALIGTGSSLSFLMGM